MPSVRDYGVVFAVAAGVTFVVTGVVRWIAPRIGAIVQPDERRVHERPTPTLGGIAMFVGLIAGLTTAWKMDVFNDQLAPGAESIGMLLAALIILLVGLVDDIRDISPPAKLAGMVLAGSVLSFAGIGIVVFRVPFLGVTPLTPDLSALITVLWVVGMANAINLIDGLDGLAAGIVGIAAVTMCFYAMRLSDQSIIFTENPGALIAAITAGLCLGFLPHNFHPARIFMGDAGALMLGPADGRVDDGCRWPQRAGVFGSVVLLLRTDLHPTRDSRRAVARLLVRHRAPHGPAAAGSRRPTRNTSTTV